MTLVSLTCRDTCKPEEDLPRRKATVYLPPVSWTERPPPRPGNRDWRD